MPTIQFFPIDITTKNIENSVAAVIYGRTASGERISVIDAGYTPYFYVIPKGQDTELFEREIRGISLRIGENQYSVIKTEKKSINLFEKSIIAIKVYINNPFGSTIIANEISKRNNVAAVYEHDIPFLQNYLTDKKISFGFAVNVEGEIINKFSKIPVIRASSVVFNEDEAKYEPKILAFDVETYAKQGSSSSPDSDAIMMISFHAKDFKKTITWKKFETEDKSIEFADSEYELLNIFKKILDEYKPDYLVGYTSDLFAFPYLKKRADKYGLALDICVDKSIADVGREETKIKGIAHIDLYKFISKVFSSKLETDSYRLKDAAAELLGESKKQIDLEKMANIWDNEPEKLQPFCEYNAHDAYLIFKMAEKTIHMIHEISKMTGMNVHDVTRGNFTEFVESYLVKESRNSKEIIPNKPSSKEYSSRKANVQTENIEADPGVYSNVIVYDFALLQPSIIAVHNISRGSLKCNCCSETVPGQDMHFCRKVTGFIPRIVSSMLDRKRRIQKMLNDTIEKSAAQMQILSARNEVLSGLARSFYGVYAYPSSRWFCSECTTAVSAYSNLYLNLIIKKAKDAGFSVIATDSDSIFLKRGNQSSKASESLFDSISASLPEKIELTNEGIYPKAMFVASKKGKSIRKKYALLSQQGFLKIRGFESTRRNLSVIAKETQERVLYMILKDKNPGAAVLHVKQMIEDLRNKIIPLKKTIIYTQLQKELNYYETNAPHVAVAKHMQKSGFTVAPGLIIKYIVAKKEGTIAERSCLPNETNSYDPDYYIENQIIPAVDKIFEAAGININKALEEKEQSNLREFI